MFALRAQLLDMRGLSGGFESFAAAASAVSRVRF
jgi:hypothetical protein